MLPTISNLFTPRTLSPHERQSIVRPFLRWAGGKQKLLSALIDHLPPPDQVKRYFEPFLGAGSLYLAKGFPNAVLSDQNPHLINAFIEIRDNPADIHRLLAKHLANLAACGADYYYEQRNLYNTTDDKDLEQAARFIFLNHANYNGVYRVNKKGGYNVPFGKQLSPQVPSLTHLLKASRRLQNTDIHHADYHSILPLVQKGDLVYLDPPYPVLSKTANFNSYTVERFSEEDQVNVAKFANALRDKGAFVMVSNTLIPLITDLYKGWKYKAIPQKRTISSKRPPMTAIEMIIYNYTPHGKLPLE